MDPVPEGGSPATSTGPTVSVATASQLTGLSKKAIRRRIERGTLKSTLLEGHHHIPITELQRSGILSERAVSGEDGPGEVEPLFSSGSASSARTVGEALADGSRADGGRGATPGLLAALEQRDLEPAASVSRSDLAAVDERLSTLERRLAAQAEAHQRVESTVAELRTRLGDVQTHQRSLAAHLHQVQAWLRQLAVQRRSRLLRRHRG
jgi:uncharacterized coiled-coil protein SlyX